MLWARAVSEPGPALCLAQAPDAMGLGPGQMHAQAQIHLCLAQARCIPGPDTSALGPGPGLNQELGPETKFGPGSVFGQVVEPFG